MFNPIWNDDPTQVGAAHVFCPTGGSWVEHGGNTVETNGHWTVFCVLLSLAACLSRSIVGSLNVAWWVFARVKGPLPHSLWRSCTSTDAGNVSHTAKTSGVPMLALRNRSCRPALRRTKSCRTWDWLLHMLFPVALCGLVWPCVALWWVDFPMPFPVLSSFPMSREPWFAWSLPLQMICCPGQMLS